MIALLTSCGRPDLLKITLDSFYKDLSTPPTIILHEDDWKNSWSYLQTFPEMSDRLIYAKNTKGLGQHNSITNFLNHCNRLGYKSKYYIHLEDDWEFDNTYDWIAESIRVMEADQSIIKVLCRKDSPHPCEHDQDNGAYGIIKPWTSSDKRLWHGFSWNPGVTRFDLLNQFTIKSKSEEDVSAEIYHAGYKTAELSKGVYTHIGDGRSTH